MRATSNDDPAPVRRELTVRDLEVIEFARAWWMYAGRREAVVLERFGYSITRYFQLLDFILDHPDAVAYDGPTINRLRDLRVERKSHRTGALL